MTERGGRGLILKIIYRLCAAYVRRLNFPYVYHIISVYEWQKNGCFHCILQKKRTWNHEQTMFFNSIGNYQTIEVHRLSACSRENAVNNGLYYTVLYSILPLKMTDSPYNSVLDDVHVTAQGP